jgi:hypothetical protein
LVSPTSTTIVSLLGSCISLFFAISWISVIINRNKNGWIYFIITSLILDLIQIFYTASYASIFSIAITMINLIFTVSLSNYTYHKRSYFIRSVKAEDQSEK